MPPLSFPSRPLFAAARLANRPHRRFVVFARLFALALAIILGLWAIVLANIVFLGIGLIAFSFFLFFYLWWRFVSFYEGMGTFPLPANSGDAAWLDAENQWPMHIDFASALFLASLDAAPNPRAFATELLASDVGVFFSRRTLIPASDILRELDAHYRAAAPNALDLSKLAAAASEIARRRKSAFITPADFFAAFTESNRAFADILTRHDFQAKDFDHLASWLRIKREHRPQPFLERLLQSPGIGKTWAYAYTPFLDHMSSPVPLASENELHIRAHGGKVREVEEALAKSSAANVLVIGEPGVGKRTIVQGLSATIGQGQSFPAINFRRVRVLRMEEIISQPEFGTIEATLGRVFGEAERAGNIILVIEDIENYFSTRSRTHIAEGLLPFLHSPLIKVIGLATPEGAAKAESDYPVLGTLFSQIRIEEPDEKTLICILADSALALEARSRSIVSYQAIRAVYELARQYLTSVPFPEKGVTLLEEVFVAAARARVGMITRELVEEVVSRKVGAAVSHAGRAEGDALLNLEDRLHRRVVNQEQAIRAIADAVRRKRTGVAASGRPAGSFLFLGPTGVGKTETAKALAEVHFGSEENMIRLDMSEYQTPNNMARLIGSRDGNEAGFLAREIRAKPFSLVLLDEVEKAHPNILNLFLQILDEGTAKDAYDKKIDFTNAIVVATSNAGAEFIRESLARGIAYPELQRRLIDEIFRQNIFRPEFLNRFDGVIVYTPLSLEHVRQVALLMLKKLTRRLEDKGYHLAWDEGLVPWLAERGYSQVFGGRELRRVVQDELESSIAKEILSGNHAKGSTIHIATPKTPETPAHTPEKFIAP